jgi:hypothetical protein
MIAPGPVRDAVVNWSDVVPALLERCRREAVGGVLDGETSGRIARLREQPEVIALLHDVTPGTGTVPVINIVFAFGAGELRFFSVVSTIGTPVDVTAQELRVEAFFPADAATHEAWTAGRS